MNFRNHGCAIVAAAAAAIAGSACAQENGKVMIDVADCIKLFAPEARLACYEQRVAAVFGERAAQAAAARPAAPAPASAAPRRAPEPAPAANPVAPVDPVAPAPSPRTASAAPPPATAPSVPAAAEPAPSYNTRQSRREENERAAADAAAQEIVSRVTELHEVLPNAWQVTLENGQVWRQTFSKHYELRAGAQVRIYGTHWGNAMRLTAENLNGYIQVERVR